jgi:hypothetical protein
LPFTKTKIFFRELNTQEQLLITKANVTFSSEKENLIEYHLYILDVVLNCIKNKNDFLRINIIEYILFLLKLKILSVGSVIDFLLDNDNKKSKTKIQFDLKKYMLNLFNITKELNDESSIVESENFKIRLTWPSLISVPFLSQSFLNSKNTYDVFKSAIYQFIDYIEINEQKILWIDLSNDEKIKLFEKLPVVLIKKIEDNVLNSVKKLIDYNLFDLDFFKNYIFNVFNLNFIDHIKLIFSHDLKSLYREIYFLATNNLSPTYVLTLSDFERKTFLTIIQEEIKRSEDQNQRESGNPNVSNEYSDAVKKLAVEFNQNTSK